MSCGDEAHCAVYEMSGSYPYTLIAKSGATSNYRNCIFDTTNQGISCEEKITSGSTHHCTTTAVGSQGHKCANGAPVSNNICPASPGGDGAVVILW